MRLCKFCGGDGIVRKIEVPTIPQDETSSHLMSCPVCQGSGEVPDEWWWDKNGILHQTATNITV
jgi:DnaJ-class molecular chaperone